MRHLLLFSFIYQLLAVSLHASEVCIRRGIRNQVTWISDSLETDAFTNNITHVINGTSITFESGSYMGISEAIEMAQSSLSSNNDPPIFVLVTSYPNTSLPLLRGRQQSGT